MAAFYLARHGKTDYSERNKKIKVIYKELTPQFPIRIRMSVSARHSFDALIL